MYFYEYNEIIRAGNLTNGPITNSNEFLKSVRKFI